MQTAQPRYPSATPMPKEQETPLQAMLETTLAHEEVRKLPIEQQADMIYTLLGRITDALVELGFDQGVIANVVHDLGVDLQKLHGGPIQVVQVDPRPQQPRYVALPKKR